MARNVYLGIGSNMGDRMAFLAGAVSGITALSVPGDVTVSPIYETEPIGGPLGQDPYLNMVVKWTTELSAKEILEVARVLEARAGRVRQERFGPRTLDVDVLFIEGEVVATEELEVPHPRMWQRKFVLAPLRDLAPELVPDDAFGAATGDVRRVGLAVYGS
jgi:2-amino-4-hydroxy-6-hydroxymethyldihydropteridine diphosphokinase